MCGIVGYLGTRQASPILLDCLERLEYRGYDSAGVGLLLPDGINVTRSAGRLAGLAEKLSRMNGHASAARVGIGHTRWATHGRPTEQNAHPHSSPDGKIVVVHNGIFENFRELRAELVAHGVAPTSQTDTECFPLLMHVLMGHGIGFEEAFRLAVKRMEGKYALACLHADHPDKILLARSGPTLVVGMGDGEYFIASDVAPLLPHTRKIAFLEDGDVAELTRAGLEVFDRDEHSVERQTLHIDWESGAAELNGYDHFMRKEIFEQPTMLARTVEAYLRGDEIALDQPLLEDAWTSVERIAIIACGTSWHAGLVGKFLIEQLAQVPVDVDYASEYRYRSPVISANTLAIAITQSGETADTIAALREARGQGARTLAICNVVGSQITRAAEGSLITHAGPEIGVASTKAFTTQLAVLSLLALHIGSRRGTLDPSMKAEMVRGLRALPAQIEGIRGLEAKIESLAQRYYRARNALYLGRGMLYPIALEGALKLKEISYVHAEGYPAGELKHGPIALIDNQIPVVALMPDDRNRERTLSNLQEAAARDGKIIALVSEGDRALDDIAEAVIELPLTHPSLAPILYSVPLQLFAYHIGVLRGCDVDRPRNLAKSVTVE
ncbi:MAG TPA: glutamine--fructose-6-phosphate transaminase (isomerizing) [Polyangiaceae bacterium]|jgi:glucosamine--fructose-6-phosphate aminotransferase (isomerizing)|nr:glutamine--fructose-6-phosphate transaminase (isomerizing) [Polyangiaceae bacterium]